MQRFVKAAVAAALLSSSAAASAASYIVLGQAGADLEAAVAKAGGKVTKKLAGIDAVVAEGSGDFKAAAAKQTGVQSVVPNLVIDWHPGKRATNEAATEAVDPPNNPPGSIDRFFNLQWGHTAIKAVDAWNAGFRGQGARVAVLDGGFSLNHPDIASQYDPSCTADMTGEGIAYGPNDDDPSGIFSHGMHTAGTVAAARNGIGSIGVAPEAKLCLVKVLFNAGSGSFADVAEGIIYAANHNVDVISMSLGGSIYKSGVKGEYTATDAVELRHLIDRAVSYAYKRGSLVITSAGNDANNGDKDKNLIHLPSDSPQAISISATAPVGWAKDPNTSLDVPTSYTNYGRSVINLAAPGGDVWPDVTGVCTVGGITNVCLAFDLVFSTGAVAGGLARYYWSGGTSMATPHVSGVAALIVSKYGKMHPSQLRAYLNKGADDLGQPGKDPYYGAGRVNAIGSLE
jgi:subtilisin family serine protease